MMLTFALYSRGRHQQSNAAKISRNGARTAEIVRQRLGPERETLRRYAVFGAGRGAAAGRDADIPRVAERAEQTKIDGRRRSRGRVDGVGPRQRTRPRNRRRPLGRGTFTFSRGTTSTLSRPRRRAEIVGPVFALCCKRTAFRRCKNHLEGGLRLVDARSASTRVRRRGRSVDSDAAAATWTFSRRRDAAGDGGTTPRETAVRRRGRRRRDAAGDGGATPRGARRPRCPSSPSSRTRRPRPRRRRSCGP